MRRVVVEEEKGHGGGSAYIPCCVGGNLGDGWCREVEGGDLFLIFCERRVQEQNLGRIIITPQYTPFKKTRRDEIHDPCMFMNYLDIHTADKQ